MKQNFNTNLKSIDIDKMSEKLKQIKANHKKMEKLNIPDAKAMSVRVGS